jgi:hypothetical protein
MYFYNAYDIKIESDIKIPELIEAEQDFIPASDVRILIESVQKILSDEELTDQYFQTSQNSVYFTWDLVGDFLVSQGHRIVVSPRPDIDANDVRLPLLGVVMATLLHQRGLLVLHASAVEIDGHAVVFIGEKGQGKSTMAASLFAQGRSLFSDDVVAIRFNKRGEPEVLPGVAMFKLWPDSAQAALGEDPAQLPKVHTMVPKCSRLAHEQFVPRPLPLAQVYTLNHGDELKVESLGPQEAIKELIKHTYVARFGARLLSGESGRRHFQNCMALAQKVPIGQLTRPKDLQLLSKVAAFVVHDVLKDIATVQ